MAGSKLGGLHAAETNKEKYGPDFYAKIGKLGGQAGRGYAFGHGKVDPARAGQVGGKKSRRIYTEQDRQRQSELMKKRHAEGRYNRKEQLGSA